MGKTWDGGDVAFHPETWTQVLRVMKPGAFMIAFASTRGYHRMVCAIKDAGFVIHPMLAWIFGTGFPKSTKFKCPEAEGWRYGLQALKPAVEPICMAQKPLVGTGTENWLRYGVGGLNIEGCRISTDDVIPIFEGERHYDDRPHAPIKQIGIRTRDGEPSADRRYTDEGATNFSPKPGMRRPLRVSHADPGNGIFGAGVHGSDGIM